MTINLDKPKDIRLYTENMLAIIGEAVLKEKGIYQCLINNKKVDFVISKA